MSLKVQAAAELLSNETNGRTQCCPQLWHALREGKEADCCCVCICRGNLLTGCVAVNGVDKCFPGDFSQGSAPCAKLQGGYNLTSLAQLLAAGEGADAKEGSLCDPKVSRHCCEQGVRECCMPPPRLSGLDSAIIYHLARGDNSASTRKAEVLRSSHMSMKVINWDLGSF